MKRSTSRKALRLQQILNCSDIAQNVLSHPGNIHSIQYTYVINVNIVISESDVILVTVRSVPAVCRKDGRQKQSLK